MADDPCGLLAAVAERVSRSGRHHGDLPGLVRCPTAAREKLGPTLEQAALALFAERGYHGTAMNEIARRSGVTPPVVYDHFASKVALHQRLLERTRDELLAMWRDNLGGAAALEEQVARAFTAWALYVHANPYAPRVFFRETTGVEEVRRLHEEIAAGANDALSAIIGGLSPGAASAGRDEQRPLALQMAAEVIRGGLTELAIWWTGHPEVTSEEIVATAMDTVWIGLQQVSDGKRWSAPPP